MRASCASKDYLGRAAANLEAKLSLSFAMFCHVLQWSVIIVVSIIASQRAGYHLHADFESSEVQLIA